MDSRAAHRRIRVRIDHRIRLAASILPEQAQVNGGSSISTREAWPGSALRCQNRDDASMVVPLDGTAPSWCDSQAGARRPVGGDPSYAADRTTLAFARIRR